MILVITLPGTSEYKAQMVAPSVGVRAKVPVTSEVIRHSQRSLWILEVIWAFFHGGHLLGSAPSYLLLQRLLAQACSHRCSCLRPLLQRLLAWAWFGGICCLGPVPVEVAG